MSEQNIQAAQQQSVQSQEAIKPEERFNQAMTALMKFGGFPFFESFIDGVSNVNPTRKARKDRFFEEDKKEERKKLLKNVEMWISLLEENSNMDGMLDKCTQEIEETSDLLKNNQLSAVERVRDMERAYREMKSFFDNTGVDKVKNISIVNASHQQITDLDNPVFIDYIADEIKHNYDRLDLRDNYSLLILPGYLGSKTVIDKWARIAHDNKVQLFTDFSDLENSDDVMEMFYDAKLTGADAHLNSTSMACNWIVGRPKYQELGEDDDLAISPASALSGRIYSTLMSQISAGAKYGTIYEVDSVRFNLMKSEITQLEKMGLVPLVKEYGKVMAFSGKTLFNGPNDGYQTYSVVRVFNQVGKTAVDFFNRRAFENWTMKSEQDVRKEMVRYLDSIKGPSRLIEKYEILRLERDEANGTKHIYFDLFMKPYFPGKTFVMKMHGSKGEDSPDWNSEVDQK